MKLKEIFLTEALSPVVYHFTDFRNFHSILSKNAFYLAPTFASNEYSMSKGKTYYMSTARTRTGSFLAGRQEGVLMVLDGRRLSQRYGGTPVDYYGGSTTGMGMSEQEDRIVSNKDSIPNAMSYMLGVDILVETSDRRKLSLAVANAKILQSKNIPFRIYTNFNDWRVGSRKFISLEELEDILQEPTSSLDTGYQAFSERAKKVARGILFLFDKKISDIRNINDFSDDAIEALKALQNNSLANIIKNNMRSPDEEGRQLVYQISIRLRRNGLINLRDMERYIGDKWTPLLQ